MDDLIGEFISETSESLAALERALGEHARQPMTRDGWDMAYRLMHTIKGTCGFLRFARMEGVAAQSEQLLAALRDGDAPPTPDQLSVLRSKMAQISYMMDYLAREGSEPDLPAPPPVVEPALIPTAPPPEPETTPPAAVVAPVQEQLREQLHRSPADFTMPRPPTALALRPAPPQEQERVSYATLATLMKVRNQLKHSLGKQDANVKALEALLANLKDKLLDRPAGPMAYPRPAELVLVASGSMRFALEQAQVHEIVRIGPQQRLDRLEEGAMISLRGGWLPRLSLAQRLGQESSAEEAYAMVLETEEGRVALCVEQIEGLEQLMLQAVPRLLHGCHLYQAAAILGDGSPCLILNPQQLVVKHAPPEAELSPVTPAAGTLSLLLFSDGTATQKALPLAEVARVEPLPVDMITRTVHGITAMCRGEALQLHLLPASTLPEQGDINAVLLQGAPLHGIVAHRMGGIVDVTIQLPHDQGNRVLARHTIDGKLTEILSPSHVLTSEATHG